MRLLITTQAVDLNDPVLGFFHRWVEEFAARFDSVVVICLKEGRHTLPANVRVLSLGKEKKASRIQYVSRLLHYAWRERAAYDAVFVHQNQEYVLLAGWLWKLLGKRIYMWRNHYAGSLLTRLAGALCAKVFFTSKHSYTASFPNAIRMPVGVDTKLFKGGGDRTPRSILFLARMAPSKHPDVLVEALGLLKERGVAFTASFYGSPLPKDAGYYAALVERARSLGLSNVVFYAGIPHDDTPRVYAAHQIFVNLSAPGMYDKTIFEAAASGCVVVARNEDLAALAGDQYVLRELTAPVLAEKIQTFLVGALAPSVALQDSANDRESLSQLSSEIASILGGFPAY